MVKKRSDSKRDEDNAEDDASAEVQFDERADQMKAEEQDQGAGDGSEKRAVLAEEGTDGAGGGAKTDEDDGEAGDESESGREKAGSGDIALAELLHADAGKHGNVAGNERQHAGREKRDQPGEKSSC